MTPVEHEVLTAIQIDVKEIKTILTERCAAHGERLHKLETSTADAHKRIDDVAKDAAKTSGIVATVIAAGALIVKGIIGK